MKRFKDFPMSWTSSVDQRNVRTGAQPQMLLPGGAGEETTGIRLYFIFPFYFFIPPFRPFPVCRLDGHLPSQAQDIKCYLSDAEELWGQCCCHDQTGPMNLCDRRTSVRVMYSSREI